MMSGLSKIQLPRGKSARFPSHWLVKKLSLHSKKVLISAKSIVVLLSFASQHATAGGFPISDGLPGSSSPVNSTSSAVSQLAAKSTENRELIRAEAQKRFCGNPENARPEISANLGCYQIADSGAGIGSFGANVGAIQVALNDSAKFAKLKREIEFLDFYISKHSDSSDSIKKMSVAELLENRKMYATELAGQIKALDDAESSRIDMAQINSILELMGGGSPITLKPDQREVLSRAVSKVASRYESRIKQIKVRIASYQTTIEQFKSKIPSDSTTSKIQQFQESIELAQKSLTPIQASYDQLMSCLVVSSDGKSGPFESKALASVKQVVGIQAQQDESSIQFIRMTLASDKQQIMLIEQRLKAVQEAESLRAKGGGPKDSSLDSMSIAELQDKLSRLEEKALSSIENVKSRKDYQNCGLSVAEHVAVVDYSGSGYLDLNAALRAGGDAAEKYAAYRDTLNEALKRFAPYRGDVMRGGNLPEQVANLHKPGNVVEYNAFTSTSFTSGFDSSDMFVIHSHNGHYIGPLAVAYAEDEVLFAANSKFKVLSVTKTPSGKTEYVMEEVDP